MEFTIYFILTNNILSLIILKLSKKINLFKKEVFIMYRKI